MSTIRANSITNSAGTGAPDFPNGLTDNSNAVLNSASSLPAANLTGTLPAIDGSALTNLPAPTTAQIGTATAGLGAGSVGTYALLWASVTATRAPGATLAGSSLRYTNTYTDTAAIGYSSTSPAGTWQLMGTTGTVNGGISTSLLAGASVWLRIS